MPVYIATQAAFQGLDSIPFLWPILKAIPWLGALVLLKLYFAGSSNGSERNMHGKVVMVTGGTSGVGAAVVRDLATRGAQIVLLTQHSLGDPFIVEYIDDLRGETGNQLITAEQVDLASLHSIRTFATKWIDNAPPRRLDMVVLCANTVTTSAAGLESTREGVELNWQVNYLSAFHLLSILSPALRSQPADREVRVVFGTCSSYMGGDLLHITPPAAAPKPAPGKPPRPAPDAASHAPTRFSPANAYATSKLALTSFALAFQKHLATHKRPDGMPNHSRVVLVDPGLCRTPGTRRWLTGGSLIGLLFYLLTYPLWWLVLKSPEMGAQSFLYAAMDERFARGDGGWLIKECRERPFARAEVTDEAAQRNLWEYSERMVQEAEKRGVEARARQKREEQDRQEEAAAAQEMAEYQAKVGKKGGRRKEGSRRSKKAG